MPGALLAALLLIAAGPAAAAEAAVTTEVPAGQSRSVRLRGIPAGSVVAVRVVTSGRLLVALVGMKQDYLLVLSNRAGRETLSVEVEIRVLRRPSKPAPKDYSPRPEKASAPPPFA